MESLKNSMKGKLQEECDFCEDKELCRSFDIMKLDIEQFKAIIRRIPDLYKKNAIKLDSVQGGFKFNVNKECEDFKKEGVKIYELFNVLVFIYKFISGIQKKDEENIFKKYNNKEKVSELISTFMTHETRDFYFTQLLLDGNRLSRFPTLQKKAIILDYQGTKIEIPYYDFVIPFSSEFGRNSVLKLELAEQSIKGIMSILYKEFKE